VAHMTSGQGGDPTIPKGVVQKGGEGGGEVQGRNPAELSSLHLAIVCLFLQL